MNCVIYNDRLQKKIPCVIIPGDVKVIENSFKRDIYVHVYFDSTKFVEYNLTEIEVKKYCSEFVNVHDLYPIVTNDQITYANTVIPNGVTNNSDELDRYEALINMLTNVVGDISKELFYVLSDLVSYELLFNKCTYDERIFMMSITTLQLTEQPAIVLVPQMLRMTKRLFDKYTSSVDTYYDLDNYNNYYEHDSSLPITINIDNLKYNVNFIIT